VSEHYHVCLLTSGRVFEIHYGGEGGFTRAFGVWLAERGKDVTIMGSTFVGVGTRRISAGNNRGILTKQPGRDRKVRIAYPPYIFYFLSRILISLMWVIRILVLNIRHPVTLIHAQDTGYAGLAAVISGKILRTPVVISSHGIRHKSLESIVRGVFRKRLLKLEYHIDVFSARNADCMIVISPVIKKYFEAILPQKEFHFIPTPIKVREFQFSESNRHDVRREFGIDGSTIVIGYVGRMSPEKNLLTLLKAFSIVAQEFSTAKLVLVGAGIMEAQLRSYVADRGLEDAIIFSGVRNDVGRILSGIDIFVLPSYTEGLGAALLEAMACSRPSIVSDIATFREVVKDKREALLINPYSPEELVHAIKMLMRDASLREELGSNAKIRAAAYDEGIVFPNILELYTRLWTKEKVEAP